MNDVPTLAPASRQAPLPRARRRLYSLSALRSMVATWRERIRLRRELEEMSRTNPHMIKDIGLTSWQVEGEIAKRFWQP